MRTTAVNTTSGRGSALLSRIFPQKRREIAGIGDYCQRVFGNYLEIVANRFDDSVKRKLRRIKSRLLKLLICFRIFEQTIVNRVLRVFDLFGSVKLQLVRVCVKLQDCVLGKFLLDFGQ